MNNQQSPTFPPVIVRPLESRDYAGWRPLWDGYNAFYGRSGPTALPAEIIDTTWKRLLDDRESMHALIAEENGQLVGLAHFLYHRSTITVQQVCYLQDLFTLPSMRGRGIARALILRIYEHARQSGSPRVYWQTHQTNTTAMRLYDDIAERSGFLVYRHSP